MSTAPELDPQAGVRNLLVNCANAHAGQRLLIASESPGFGYFDADVLDEVQRGAAALGLITSTVDVGFSPTLRGMPDDLRARIGASDVVIFLCRLGGQLRFSEMPEGQTRVVCFALNAHLMGSRFGTAHHAAFTQLKAAVDRRLVGARDIRITCAAGTDVTGHAILETDALVDTSSHRFPMSVSSPVPATGFSGRVALSGFLTGTGTQYYDDYTIEFAGQVFAHLDMGRLTGFDGAREDVAKANAQYDRVSALFGIERNCVHSWHAGIHPGCGFPWDIRRNYTRWGGAAFGNPRILHFHTCGADVPGEISWNIFDPTVTVDGVPIWEHGQLHPEVLEGGQGILDRYPSAAAVFANPDRDIGLGDTV